MKLSIIDTEKKVEHEVYWVELNTPVGNMVIQDNHVPIIVELVSGKEVLFELTSGKKESFVVSQAVAHVTRLEVKILIPLVS